MWGGAGRSRLVSLVWGHRWWGAQAFPWTPENSLKVLGRSTIRRPLHMSVSCRLQTLASLSRPSSCLLLKLVLTECLQGLVP